MLNRLGNNAPVPNPAGDALSTGHAFLFQMAAMKRPSPEPVEVTGKLQKKPKVQKKKKKRDPNEPQK